MLSAPTGGLGGRGGSNDRRIGVRGAMRAPPLLLTKMHPPPQRAQTVVRDRLVERLRASPEVRLTVVAAPAGYGKSTLLGTWRELEAETRPVAWLTLDEGDNDPVVLWSYILAALRTACPELGVTSSPDVLGAPRILDLFLPVLVNELAALGDAAIVLDDFHRLTNGPARESIAWLVERAPSTFRVVLATRTEPALPLASLRAHGDLLELRADELGFTSAEADVLLNDRLDLGLDPPRDSGSRRTYRGVADGTVPRGPLCPGSSGSARVRRSVRRREPASRRLPHGSGARSPRSGDAGADAAHFCARAAVWFVVQRSSRAGRAPKSCWRRSRERTFSSYLSTTVPSGTGSTMSSLRCCASSSSIASPASRRHSTVAHLPGTETMAR